MTTVVEVRELQKRYGEIEAVRGVSFCIPEGETFGFLGPNGAGKTTTISILCTLIQPTGGSAEVGGFDVVAQPSEVRRRIGLVFQDPTLDDYLTAEENLRFHAELYGMPRADTGPRIRQVLEMVELWNRRKSVVKTFSGGMRRRLEIARGLLHSPRVLFLDEPTVGLDPQTRTHIWSYIEELKRRERITIFLTTYYDALHGRGRALRPDRDHRRRADRRPRYAGGAEGERRTRSPGAADGRRRRRDPRARRTVRPGGHAVGGSRARLRAAWRRVRTQALLGVPGAHPFGERCPPDPRRRLHVLHRPHDPRRRGDRDERLAAAPWRRMARR